MANTNLSIHLHYADKNWSAFKNFAYQQAKLKFKTNNKHLGMLI